MIAAQLKDDVSSHDDPGLARSIVLQDPDITNT